MKKKQTYIIGEESPKASKKKSIQIDTKQSQAKKKPKKSRAPKNNYDSKPKYQINNAFAEAFAKAGLTAKDFKKKS